MVERSTTMDEKCFQNMEKLKNLLQILRHDANLLKSSILLGVQCAIKVLFFYFPILYNSAKIYDHHMIKFLKVTKNAENFHFSFFMF